MDFQTAFLSLNWLAVIVAAVSCFVVGGIWYSALFSKAWMKANGFDDQYMKKGSPVVIFGVSLVAAFLIALNLALFLGPAATAGSGALAGFLAGFFWVGLAFAITYLFERRPFSLFAINAGYHVVSFTIMGLIIGAWH
jgi:hypothetical protein